jgi:acyl-CoA thioesterase I
MAHALTTSSQRRPAVCLLALGLLFVTLACDRSPADNPGLGGRLGGAARTSSAPPATAPSSTGPATPQASASPAPTSRPTAASRRRIVVLGDSLSAGLGLEPQQAYPALLQKKVDAQGLDFEVVNAGVSGDTSADGLRRFDWALDGDVRVLVIELGANDGLRGLPVEQMAANLSRIIERAQQRHITVLLCGMEAPPNFGASYTAAFRAAYRDVAQKHHVALLPFLLDGVAGLEPLNQADGIHPNVQGAQRVAETVWAALRPMLGDRTSSS